MRLRIATFASLALLLFACGSSGSPGSSRPTTPAVPETESDPAQPAATVATPAEETPEAAAAQIYIVRHAEKQSGKDPELTEAGHKRARALAALLADEELAAIVTTHLKRTQQTAAPTSRAKGIDLTVVTIADDHATHISDVTRAAREAGGHVLIVGHSDTVPDIVAGFGATRPDPIDESAYNNLFVVTLAADGSASVERRDLPAE